jgi:nucleoside phosphorylase
MDTAINAGDITVVTATGVETKAARKVLPSTVRIVQCGIGLSCSRDFGEVAISCGLAGGLREDLPTGTVVIPRYVRRPDGTSLICDPELSEMLREAAQSLGHNPVDGPLLTSKTLVHGHERARWGSEFAAVDMESGLITAARVACVRVILDTPQREISPAWLQPARAAVTPSAWRDLPFLAREGQRCARLAAKIIAGALPR